MTPEQTLTIISIAAVIGTGFNVYLSLKIGNSVDKLKLWVREHFVAKSDLYHYKERDAS